MLKKSIIVILFVMLFCSFSFADEDTIKIGANVTLTGPSSMWGISELNALKMAVEKINQGGGVLGKKIELIYYDNRTYPPEAVIVNQRLINRDHVVAIVGPAQSGTFISARTIAEENKIPEVGTTPTSPYATCTLDGKPLDYAFKVCFTDAWQGKIAADFAYKELGKRTAAIIYDVGSDCSAWLAHYFMEHFRALGGKVVRKEAFRTGELDFRAILGKIKPFPIDLLYVTCAQKEAGLIAKQARGLAITATIMGGDSAASPDLMTIGGEATEGMYLTNLADLGDPLLVSWVEEYEKIYKTEPVLPNPAMAVDALYVIVDAIKRAGTTDGPALAKAIKNTKNLKILTTDAFSIDPLTHNPLNRPVVINLVKDGKFTFVTSYKSKIGKE